MRRAILVLLFLTSCASMPDAKFLEMNEPAQVLYLKHEVEKTQRACYIGLAVTSVLSVAGIAIGLSAVHGVKAIGEGLKHGGE
jgi:hypothetical protein